MYSWAAALMFKSVTGSVIESRGLVWPARLERKWAPFDNGQHGATTRTARKTTVPRTGDVEILNPFAAVSRDQAVNRCALRAELDQAPPQRRANEAEPAGDQHVGAGEN